MFQLIPVVLGIFACLFLFSTHNWLSFGIALILTLCVLRTSLIMLKHYMKFEQNKLMYESDDSMYDPNLPRGTALANAVLSLGVAGFFIYGAYTTFFS